VQEIGKTASAQQQTNAGGELRADRCNAGEVVVCQPKPRPFQAKGEDNGVKAQLGVAVDRIERGHRHEIEAKN
jgi:hypothetical protein